MKTMKPRSALQRTRLQRVGVGLFAAALTIGLWGCSGKSDADLLSSAKEMLAKNDTKGAVIQIKSALQKNANLAEARFLLGKTLLATGDTTGALVELTKAQELQFPEEQVAPEMARAMLYAGEGAKLLAKYADVSLKDASAAADLKTSVASAYAEQGDLARAKEVAEEALKLRPGFAPALILQARALLAEGQADGAMALLDKVLAADPASEAAGMLKGEVLLQLRRDADGAQAAFRAVLAAHPTSVTARAAIANILFQQQKLDAAKVEFAELKKIAPNHPETLFFEAQLAFNDKDYKRAREISDQILKNYPNNVRVLELAGAAEYRMKGYVQAEALLGKSLKLAPKQVLSRFLLAQTYLRTGQPSKTIDVLQPYLEGKQPSGTALALAGEAYLQLGDAKHSEEAFQRALKASPQDARVRTSAAMAEMARGNAGGAISELESVASGDSGPRADLALVSARLRQNDLDGALKAIAGLEKKVPDQALPLLLRGRVLALKNDVPGATKNFEAALAKDPAYFPAVASLAALDMVQKKPEAARARFDAYIKAQPQSWQARLARAELEARTGAPATTVMATLREAVKANPSEAKPHLVLIGNLINSGDGAAALQAAQDATAALPNSLELMDAQGRAELAAGDNQRAVSTFKKLASLQPRNPQHEMRLAEAYMATKDMDAAGRSLRHAAELQPDNMTITRALAKLALIQNRPQDALTIARDMQKRMPKDAAGYTLEGEIEASRKGWDAATLAYRASLQRAPSPETTAKLHTVLNAAGKTADADRLAADWAQQHPKDTALLYFLGDVALAQNDFVRAEAKYRAVLAIQPENALALNNVAWLMVKQGKPGAVAVAEKANSLLPNRAPLLDTWAMTLEADNQLPKAIETQKQAIAVEPKDGSLSLRLAKLYIKAGDKARARAELDALSKLGDKFPGQAEVTTLQKTL